LSRDQVQNRAGDVLQFHQVFADGHPPFGQEILLVKVFDEFAVNLARHGDVVLQSGLGGQKIFEIFFVMHVLVEINRFLNEVLHGTKHLKHRLEKLGRTIAKSVHELVPASTTSGLAGMAIPPIWSVWFSTIWRFHGK
jgi:hypothetical protein